MSGRRGNSWLADAFGGIGLFLKYWLYDRPRDFILPSGVAGYPRRRPKR